MTKEELAAAIDGVQYRKERTRYDPKSIYKEGLVVVYGASDDLVEFDGGIYDECGAFGGGTVFVTPKGIVQEPDCECDAARELHAMKVATARKIEAVWSPSDGSGASWIYRTDIPHSTFKVMEDDDLYCIGIVFAMADLEAAL